MKSLCDIAFEKMQNHPSDKIFFIYILVNYDLDIGTIKMFAHQATPLYGGTGVDGKRKLTGWLSMELTCLWHLLHKKKSGGESILHLV